MCRMTDTGTRWKPYIPLPDFGRSERYWVVRYYDGTRYVREPDGPHREAAQCWLKPLYAVRITVRSI